MPFGEIVSVLRADLQPLEQDLKKAEERIRQYLNRVGQMHARIGSTSSGAAGSGPLRSISPERQMAQQLDLERKSLQVAEARARVEQQTARLRETNLRIQERQAAVAQRTSARGLMGFSHIGAQGDVNAEVRAAEQAERKIRQINEAAERDLRRVMAARAAAYKEDEQRRVAAAKAAAEAEKRVQEQATSFYRRQSGLGPVGGGPGGRPGGGPGSFVAPQNLRGLDEANAKWLKQQQAIAQSATLTERLSRSFRRMGEQDLKQLIDGTRQWVNWLGVGAASAAVGLGVSFAKYALDTNKFFERSKITIAEILALTTKVVDKNGKMVSYAQQQNLNYALSEKLVNRIREASIKTALSAETLVNVFSRSLGYAVSAGARPEQAVPFIAQITNLARALGARSEREYGFEARALLTGQNITRSRIGQALSLTRGEIESARETGNLIGFLTERLKAGQPYLLRWAASWEGLTTTFQVKFQSFVKAATGELYDRLRDRLSKINQSFDPESIQRWGKAFSDYLLKAWDKAQAFFESDGFKRGLEFFKYLAEHSRQIVEAVLVFKSLEGLLRVAGVINTLYNLIKTLRGAGGAAAETAAIPGLGAGGRLAGGIAGAGGARVAAAGAGFLGTAVPIGLSLATGYGLGIGAAKLGEYLGTRAGTQDPVELVRKRNAQQQALQAAMAASEQARRQLAGAQREALLEPSPEAQSLLRGARARVQRVEEQERHLQALADPSGPAAIAGMQREGLTRVPIVDPTKAAQSNLLKMQAFVARILKKTTDDRKEQLREQEKADEATIRKTLGATKSAYDLIHRLRKHLTEKLADEDLKTEINYRKSLAEMTGNKHQQIQVEYNEQLRAIKDGNFTDAQANRLRVAARVKGMREIRDLQAAEAMEAKQFRAQATGDEIEQIRLRNTEELHDRIKQIEQEKTGLAARIAIHRAYRMEVEKNNREMFEKAHELQQRATDLQRQAFDAQINFHKTRVNAEKEFQQLQERTARELRNIMKERRDAQRELARAQQDLPGTLENLTLNRQQRDIRRQIESRFLQTANPYAPGAASLEQRATIRQLAGQIAGGDIFSSEQAIQRAGQLGYLNQFNVGGVRGLARQAAGIGMRREDLADTQADTQEQRQAEDAQRNVEDLQQRQKDLDERQAEIVQSYKDNVAALRENLTKTVVDTSDSMKKLNEEMKKLTETLRASHLPVPAALAAAMAQTTRATQATGLRRLPDGTITNLPDRTLTTQPSLSGQAGATLNFIFNGAEFKNLPQDAQEAAGVLAQHLLDLSRRTRPTSR